MRWRRPLEAAAVAALGALQTWAFVATAWWWLPMLCTALLVGRLNGASPRRAALLGWLYGSSWLGAATWWLFISMHRYGELPAPLAVAAVAALSAALSLYLAAAAGLYARWRTRRALLDAGLFGALWLLAELARGLIFTGFPWAASGYSQLDGPLAALAPWVGVYGVGAVLAALAALLGNFWQVMPGRRWPLCMAVVLGLAALGWAGPGAFTTPSGSLQVALLQTNVAQDQKFAQDRMPEALAWTARALTMARADLVVAPETAVPLLPDQLAELAPGYWTGLQAAFGAGRAALVGVPLGDFDQGYTNSVAGLSAGPEYRYDKLHLVPFGEFIPTGFRWFTEMMNIPLGDFNRGVPNPPSFVVRGERLAPNICYEDLFGEELAHRFIKPELAPTVFVNLSNIGWFDDSIALPQHLNISRFRTLEFQRPMLRATNTGATAIIDHQGRVTARLPFLTRGVLEGQVQGRQGRTPYAWWVAHAGLWPLIVGALALCVLARQQRQRVLRA